MNGTKGRFLYGLRSWQETEKEARIKRAEHVCGLLEGNTWNKKNKGWNKTKRGWNSGAGWTKRQALKEKRGAELKEAKRFGLWAQHGFRLKNRRLNRKWNTKLRKKKKKERWTKGKKKKEGAALKLKEKEDWNREGALNREGWTYNFLAFIFLQIFSEKLWLIRLCWI